MRLKLAVLAFAVVACCGGSLDLPRGALLTSDVNGGAIAPAPGGAAPVDCGEPPAGAIVWYDARDPEGDGTPPAADSRITTWVDKGSLGVDLNRALSQDARRAWYRESGTSAYLDFDNTDGFTKWYESIAGGVSGHIDAYKHVTSHTGYCAVLVNLEANNTSQTTHEVFGFGTASAATSVLFNIDDRTGISRTEKIHSWTTGDSALAANIFSADNAFDSDAWEHAYLVATETAWTITTGEGVTADTSLGAHGTWTTAPDNIKVGQADGIANNGVTGYYAQLICYNNPSAGTQTDVETWIACLETNLQNDAP